MTARPSEPSVAGAAPAHPDPAIELRMTTLHATRGANFWSRCPVTRMDMRVGAYEDISSADVPGFTEALVRAMPGLEEHRCSIGTRGGFVIRLRRGTYAPHIVEHVALELQTMIGHDVGFGRTRGGDETGEYTLVFEHLHERVGLRAAALALETVQRAFARTLEGVDHALTELRALAATPDTPSLHHRVLAGVSGGSGRAEAQAELARRLDARGVRDPLVVDVSPGFVLHSGLPYARSDLAIVLDLEPTDVAPRYQEPDRALQLMSVLADGTAEAGIVVCPAKAWELQDYARDRGCRVAVFASDDRITRRDLKVATAMACVRDGRIAVEHCGDPIDAGALDPALPVASQVAAALADFVHAGGCEPT
jgi:cyanophycin synthetase